MRIFSLALLLAVACKSAPPPKAPERLPISEQVEELSSLPAYLPPTPGDAVDVAEGETAPFDGILLDETLAFSASELRVAYDEVYQLAASNQRALKTVVAIQENELMRADKVIDQKEAQLREIRDSWWEKHKLSVGIVAGVIIGIGGTVAVGKVWAEIDKE
jgi:hypothetical protein